MIIRNFKIYVNKMIRRFILSSKLFEKILHVNQAKLFFFIVDHYTPVISNFGIKFYGLFQIPYNRGETLLTKEADMISFINDNYSSNDVYYDIGANIGVFSMYSAKVKGVRVLSFEPESSNFFILNKNILLNNLTESVTAYNIAINDINEMSLLNLKDDISPGRSGNTFKEEINQDHEKFEPKFKQGVFGISLDEFVNKYKVPFPNHIKIDIDGNEYKVINGMNSLLSDKRLKTIAVEINTKLEIDKALAETIQKFGFRRLSEYKNNTYEKSGVVNYFFKR